ncbi:MAG: TolC family protein [Smithellaceae bacterium]
MKKARLCLYILFAVAFIPVSFATAREYTLSDLYQQALDNSEKIKFAQENLFIAQMGRNKAWAVLFPRLTAFGTYNRFTGDKYAVSSITLPDPMPAITSSVLIQPQESGTWGVRADQSFSLSARELDALKIAGQTITKSEFDLDAAKTDFVLAVASSYYDVLKAKKALEITAANVERLTQYRNSAEKKVKVGELTKTSLLRADGELSGARADYLRATNAMILARAALIRITGIEESFRLKDQEKPLLDPDPFEDLRETAVNSRADLKSYEMQTKISKQYVKYARGAFWPNLGLYAIYNGVDQNPATTTLNRESVLAGVSLNFPFFEGGLRVAELREAMAKERQARLAYDDLKKNVDIELRGAYLDLETQKGALKFLEDQLIFAQDNYNAVLRQYENGLATSLDVMDANSLLLNSEKNVTEALYGYRLAHLKVRKSSGTLLQFVTAGH